MTEFNPSKLIAEASRHHQSSRLKDAERLYRQALEKQPRNADVLHLLGVLRGQAGDPQQSLDFLNRAAQIRPNDAALLCNLGEAYRFAGRPTEAIAEFRRSLQIDPQSAVAFNRLANALTQNRQFDQAIAASQKAVALEPKRAEIYAGLSLALLGKGQIDDAIAAARQAIALQPNFCEAYNNLGNLLTEQKKFDEAITAYRQAIAQRPSYAEAFYNLGIALTAKGLHADAADAYRGAVTIKTGYAVAWNNLGNAIRELGRLNEAVEAFDRALALGPNLAQAHNNRGLALAELDRLDDAIASYRKAISLNAQYPEALINLGNAIRGKGEVDQAILLYRQAIVLRPNYADAYTDLGNAFKDQGALDEAIAAYQRAMELAPTDPLSHSNFIFCLHFLPDTTASTLAQEHASWNLKFARPLQKAIAPHDNDRNPDRRLRIGYLSPDFRNHPVGRFLLPLLKHHERNAFEIFAYSLSPGVDPITHQLRACTHHWRQMQRYSDPAAAELIRRDGIDILVDLAMHTAGNALRVLARKPAPIQFTHLAYASTTGLEAVDYRFSDPYLDPPGEPNSFYTERTIRLPTTWWCYEPSPAAAEIAPRQTSPADPITFGCLNSFCKMSRTALQTWAKILQATPNSQLLLHASPGTHRQRCLDQFEQEEIDPRRIRFVGYLPIDKYFELHNQIDIALDPFPYGGGTTTCDALWMGLPVITLAGKTAVARMGCSVLSNVGLPQFIASSTEDYVSLAVKLAANPELRRELRQTLRQRMKDSPLMDAPRLAREIETAYRTAWKEWISRSST